MEGALCQQILEAGLQRSSRRHCHCKSSWVSTGSCMQTNTLVELKILDMISLFEDPKGRVILTIKENLIS